MATRRELDQLRSKIWAKEQDEDFAGRHGYSVAHERLRKERQDLEGQLQRAKFGGKS